MPGSYAAVPVRVNVPGPSRCPNALCVTLGVEVQPVAVNGEGVSTSLNRGCLWLTASPTRVTIGSCDLGHGEVSTCPEELPDG